MAYSKQTWVRGEKVASAKLNHVEDGIYENSVTLEHGIEAAVDNWLDEHPEATTTVQDHSLTYEKLVNGTLGFVTPEIFGAVGDGSTDDFQAIQDALDVGGIVVFSKKTYRISLDSFTTKTGTTNKFGLQLHSDTIVIGNNATIAVDSKEITSAYVMLCSDNYVNPSYISSSTPVKNICIYNLKLDGNEDNLQNTQSITGVALYLASNCTLDGVVMTNLCGTDGGGYGIMFAFCNGCSFTNSEITRSSRSNIYCWETKQLVCRNLILHGSTYRDCITCSTNVPISYQQSSMALDCSTLIQEFTSGTHTLRIDGVSDCVVRDCYIIGNENVDGIYIGVTTGTSIRLYLHDTTIKNSKFGINQSGSNGTNIEVYAENCYIEGAQSISFSPSNVLRLYNNICKSTDNSKNISVYSEHSVISGNVFDGYSSFYINNVSNAGTLIFTDNNLTNVGSGYAIYVSNGYSIAHGNTSSKPLRFYGNGKAYCNNAKVTDSPNLDYNEANIT